MVTPRPGVATEPGLVLKRLGFRGGKFLVENTVGSRLGVVNMPQ